MFGSREMLDLLPKSNPKVFCWFGTQLAPTAPRITLGEHKAQRVMLFRQAQNQTLHLIFTMLAPLGVSLCETYVLKPKR